MYIQIKNILIICDFFYFLAFFYKIRGNFVKFILFFKKYMLE